MQNLDSSKIIRYKVFKELKRTTSFGLKFKKAKYFFSGFFFSFILIDKYNLDQRSYLIFNRSLFRDISSDWVRKDSEEKFKRQADIRYFNELDKKSELTYLEYFKKLDKYCFLCF